MMAIVRSLPWLRSHGNLVALLSWCEEEGSYSCMARARLLCCRDLLVHASVPKLVGLALKKGGHFLLKQGGAQTKILPFEDQSTWKHSPHKSLFSWWTFSLHVLSCRGRAADKHDAVRAPVEIHH